ELARSTDEFGGAMLKAVCVQAGMIALRSGTTKVSHEHYVDAIAEVQAKKKDTVCLFNGMKVEIDVLSFLGQFLRLIGGVGILEGLLLRAWDRQKHTQYIPEFVLPQLFYTLPHPSPLS